MRVLVTGVNGFIGSHVAEHLRSKGHTIIGLANSQPAIPVDELVLADLADPQLDSKLSSLKGIGAIHHIAAITDPWDLSLHLLDTNIFGTHRLLELARKQDALFVLSSSSAVYGNLPAPYKEDGSVQPNNNYSLSKLIGEKLLQAYAQQYGLRACAFRYFNTYGIREDRKGKTASMVYHFLSSALKDSKAIFYGDGKQKRDFICVKDTVRAHEKAMDIRTKKAEVFNIGSGTATAYLAIVDIVEKVLGKPLRREFTPNPISGGYQLHTEADMAKARELLGFVPEVPLEAGIRWMAGYYAPQIRKENK